jgi:SagB-type dehydrogenase family enzyme
VDDNAPLFELFWHNSKLNRHTAQQLERRIAVDAASPPGDACLSQPTFDIRLAGPSAQHLNERWPRVSTRSFAPASLSQAGLAELLGGFRSLAPTHRPLASGGAKYPVDMHVIAFHVDGIEEGRVLYYHPEAHALARVGMAPPWTDCADMLGRGLSGTPVMTVVLSIASERSTVKYGERGGRFALIEVGMHAQNLLLSLAQQGLAGLPYAAYHDDTVRGWVMPNQPDARIALLVHCGEAAGN